MYLIIVDFIHADRAILTWGRQAFVNIILAQISIESRASAITIESTQFIITNAAMLARLRRAIIDIRFAIPSSHAMDANARKIGHRVHASGPLVTRITFAFVYVMAAIFAIISGWTNTLIVVYLDE